MAYRIAAIPVTLSDLKVIHRLQAFSYSFAAADKI